MDEGTLGAALEREHRDIDGGIDEYLQALESGAADPAPLLRSMNGLRRHIYLEEEFLFPPMRQGGMVMPIFVMLREHGELWRAMANLEPQIRGTAGGAETGDTAQNTQTDGADASTQNDGSAAGSSVASACRALLELLDAHNSKEEPIIYTQADEMLGAQATGELQNFLDTGTMPEGWECEQASGTAAPPSPFSRG